MRAGPYIPVHAARNGAEIGPGAKLVSFSLGRCPPSSPGWQAALTRVFEYGGRGGGGGGRKGARRAVYI
jgi:hypothetical protein